MPDYNYAVTDTLNNRVNDAALAYEISQAVIAPTLTEINTDYDADTLVLTFDVALSAGEETTLDGVVAAHPGDPLSPNVFPLDPYDGEQYFDPVSKQWFEYDATRGKWLSTSLLNLSFEYLGTLVSGYLKVGELFGSDVGYFVRKNATIVGLATKITGGKATKEFEIRNAGATLSTFNLTASEIKDDTIDVDLSEGDVLQVFQTDEDGNPVPWYDSDWLYRKPITIDNTQVEGTADLTNYLLYYTLTSTDFANARADGFDILFADALGNKLDHDRIEFRQADNFLHAVVRIPTLDHDADTTIYMYYGNAGATDQQNRAGVYTSEYRAVWHFETDPVGAAPELPDHTPNGVDGTNVNMDASDLVTGLQGYAWDYTFTGAGGDWTDLGNPAALDNIGAELTLLALVRNDGPNSDDAPYIVCGTGDNGEDYMLGIDGGGAPWAINVRLTVQGSGQVRYDVSGMAVGAWHAIGWKYDGNLGANPRIKVFNNGAVVSNLNANAGVVDTGSSDCQIAKRLTSDRMIDTSRIDTMMVIAGLKTDDWIGTLSNNWLDAGSFFTTGIQEDYVPPAESQNAFAMLEIKWRYAP